jgi:DNA-binding transcriptional MerR regulator
MGSEQSSLHLLTTGEVGLILGIAAETVRGYERRGWLSAIRTARGQRLFHRADVEAMAAQRHGHLTHHSGDAA